MKIRQMCLFIALLTISVTVAYSGEPLGDMIGGPCGGGGEEGQGGEDGDAGADNSDPIYLATGDFQHLQTDFFIPGRGLDFEIKRFYRARSGLYSTKSVHVQQTNGFDIGLLGFEPVYNNPVGLNWEMNYNMRLDLKNLAFIGEGFESPDPFPTDQLAPGRIYLYDGTGRKDAFKSDLVSTSLPGSIIDYHIDSQDKVIKFNYMHLPIYLHDSSQTEYKFLPFYDAQENLLPYAGRLASITDRNGNQISFEYETSNGAERVAYAIDTLGHQIDFYYHDDPGSSISGGTIEGRARLIWRIVDHAGRVVEYEYADIGSGVNSTNSSKLIKATQPAIVATPDFSLLYFDNGQLIDHGRFPNGRVWEYEYAPVGTDSFQRGMLTKITDPNGVDVIQNEYNISSNGYTTLDLRRMGRVVRQQYGDDAYNYIVTGVDGEMGNIGGNNDRRDADYDYYVWVNDRRGAITRFRYAQSYHGGGMPPDVPGLDTPRNRQLEEKTEFLGFVTDPDVRVYADCDTNGNPISWHYIDEVTGNIMNLASGPQTPDGQLGQMITTNFKPDRSWNNPEIVSPNGTLTTNTYYHQDFPPAPGVLPDPRFNKTLTSRTVSPAAGTVPMQSITEYWRYDFDIGGGGCGCGSAGYATAYQDGKGYVTIREFDDMVNPVTGRASGNLLTEYHDLPIGTPLTTTAASAAGLNPAAVDSYTYNQWGQILTHTHPSKLILDDQGDPVSHSRVDQYEYYSDPTDASNYGRLHKVHVDITTPQATGKNLTTIFEYDVIGNVVKVTEPSDGVVGGDVQTYLYNQEGQLVRERRLDHANNLFAETVYFHDANGNVVREDVKNLDGDQQPVASNTWITTIREYDDLDFMTTTSREAGVFNGVVVEATDGSGRFEAPDTNDLFVTQKWIYDGGKNLIEFQNGEAVNGIGLNQTDNVVRYEYDARDLRIKTTHGYGGLSPVITAYEYDENDRRVKTIIDPNNTLQTQMTEIAYDAFNRIVELTDPMGNQYQYEYDDNHNPVSVKVFGMVDEDIDGSLGNVVLAEVSRAYGVLDLHETQSVEIFDYNYISGNPNTASAPQVTSYVYNEDSSVRTITSPSGISTLFERNLYYDTSSRIEFQEDISGNITQYEYDVDSNITKIMQTDVSSLDSSIEIFEVIYEYDALDRRVAVIDGVGNRTETKYDSRSNVVEQEDARDNTNVYAYDSLSRQLTTSLGNGIVTTSKSYDASSRLVSETDANNNTSVYEYDALNRLVKIIMPDGEFYQAQYDANGNMSQYTDARGVVVTQTFDLNNRLIYRGITGTSIPGTTEEDFIYDGLGRLRKAQNDFSKITREYDSRSNIVRELQNINAVGNFPTVSDQEVAYEFDLANNTTKLSYPGGRDVYRAFDELNRLAGIFNDDFFADPITEFVYIGRRLQRREHGNGTRTDYTYNGIEDGLGGVTNTVGDFGFGRVAEISTTKVSSSTVLDEFAFAWDKTQNRTVYDDTGSGMKNQRERAFGYDAANRLVSTAVDFPNPLTDFTTPTNNGITTYTLDGVYNRTDVSGFESNGAPIGTYSQTGDQAKNNQYTITPRAEGGEWMNFHDENGNLETKYQTTIADFNGDHAVNFFDVSAFLAAFNLEDASADLNGDGVWNFFDVNEFLGANSALDGTGLEQWYYTYDFRNQLIEAKQVFGVSDVTLVTTNTYDPAARRVIESVDLDGDGTDDTARHLIYGCASLWEVIEQIDIATDTTMITHVYGLGIDDEVSYQYEDQSIFIDIWTHRDDLNSLTSVTDLNGDVQERYEYGDYGKVAFFDEAGVSLPSSSFNAQHLYTGRSVIAGTGLYDYRFRVMEPETGVFNQRDPLRYIDSMNMYTYVSNSPYRFVDSMGLSREGGECDTMGGNVTCEEVVQDLKAWEKELEKRVDQLLKDPGHIDPSSTNGLPERTIFDHISPSSSREGHRALIRMYAKGVKWARYFLETFCKNNKMPPPAAGPAPRLQPFTDFIKPWIPPMNVVPAPKPVLVVPTINMPDPALSPEETLGVGGIIIIIITAPFWALG